MLLLLHLNDDPTMNEYKNISIEDFDYLLPDERIAKYPLEKRSESKLLRHAGGEIEEYHFYDLPDLLPQGALLVVNDTRVIRARLSFRRTTGSRIEVFCLDPLNPALYEQALAAKHETTWHCLVGNAKKWKESQLTRPLQSGETLTVERVAEQGIEEGEAVRFRWTSEQTFGEVLESVGELPIPPYLGRATEESDLSTYQTVYAHLDGSVAAPTAGLHFTPEVLERVRAKGIDLTSVTLHVGAGTFKPVKSPTMAGHVMHSEVIQIQIGTLERLLKQLRTKGIIVSVGTTSTRTLESLYYMGEHLLEGKEEPFVVEQWESYERKHTVSTVEAIEALIEHLRVGGAETLIGATRIVIEPGFEFRLVDRLITNFHQPHSTLLLLISAIVGDDWHRIYRYALEHGFRFLSYGDSSILERR